MFQRAGDQSPHSHCAQLPRHAKLAIHAEFELKQRLEDAEARARSAAADAAQAHAELAKERAHCGELSAAIKADAAEVTAIKGGAADMKQVCGRHGCRDMGFRMCGDLGPCRGVIMQGVGFLWFVIGVLFDLRNICAAQLGEEWAQAEVRVIKRGPFPQCRCNHPVWCNPGVHFRDTVAYPTPCYAIRPRCSLERLKSPPPRVVSFGFSAPLLRPPFKASPLFTCTSCRHARSWSRKL